MGNLIAKLQGWKTILFVVLAGVVGGLKVVKTHVGMGGLPDEVFDSIITFLLGGAGIFAAVKVNRLIDVVKLLGGSKGGTQ
jgi:hypothetical protein